MLPNFFILNIAIAIPTIMKDIGNAGDRSFGFKVNSAGIFSYDISKPVNALIPKSDIPPQSKGSLHSLLCRDFYISNIGVR